MGREIRRVPPNWEHPKFDGGNYIPMYDEDYKTAADEWVIGFIDHHVNGNKVSDYCDYFWEYDSPPCEESHRPSFTEEPTWFQVYETVSEGTPVSPPFATVEELARYLSTNGDFWYQRRLIEGHLGGEHKPTYEAALAFVNQGWAMSGVVINNSEGSTWLGPYEQAAD